MTALNYIIYAKALSGTAMNFHEALRISWILTLEKSLVLLLGPSTIVEFGMSLMIWCIIRLLCLRWFRRAEEGGVLCFLHLVMISKITMSFIMLLGGTANQWNRRVSESMLSEGCVIIPSFVVIIWIFLVVWVFSIMNVFVTMNNRLSRILTLPIFEMRTCKVNTVFIDIKVELRSSPVWRVYCDLHQLLLRHIKQIRQRRLTLSFHFYLLL